MRGASLRVLLAVATTAVATTGCNAIFGIHDGTLAEGGAGGSNTGAQSAGGGGEAATGGAGGEGTGASATGGAGGGVPFDACVPSTFTDGDTSQHVGPSCGIFVDFSHVGLGTGTQADPYSDLQLAIDAHGSGQAIYVAGGTAVTGTFTIDRGGAIWGGLTTDWSRDTSLRPALVADPNGSTIPMFVSLNPNEDLLLDHLIVQAGSAESILDGSSIGIVINGGNLVVQGSEISANRGGRGHDGMNGNNGTAGVPGQPTNNGCNAGVSYMGGMQTCMANGTSVIVSGGNGGPCSGTTGQPGAMGFGPNPGNGGAATCTAGSPGAGGADAPPGLAAPDYGDWSAMNGDILGSAPRAMDGEPGSGGGGGGARQSFNGSGGGSGGCGGTGGIGGGNGGVSVAIAAIHCDVTVVDSKLASNLGGPGGLGGSGGGGGPIGSGGSTPVPGQGCAGGNGGAGGAGGAAAGGNGGSSILVLTVQGSLDVDVPTRNKSTLPMNPAPGGSGGQFPTAASNGAQGHICAHVHFDAMGGTSCMFGF